MRRDESFEPILTERLRMRRSVPEDAEAISAYRSVPDVGRYQGWDRTDAPFLRHEFEAMAVRDPGDRGWVQLTLEERETGELIGDVGMSPADGEPGVLKIGYTVSPTHQGKGIATEAVRALVTYAFERLGADVVRIYADADNTASIRVAEKAGLTFIERFEGHDENERWYAVRYEIRRDDAAAAGATTPASDDAAATGGANAPASDDDLGSPTPSGRTT
jgi:RimJ/RimL family protein N-acetyltransferase